MPIGAAIGAAGSIGAAGLGYLGSQQASKAQALQAQNALNTQTNMFQTGLNATQPFVQAGQSVLPTLQKLLTPGANQTDTLNQLPGFQFAQDWGQKAVQNLGTTLGLGGNTLSAGAQFATGTAQQGFGSLVNMLQSFANTGASAASSIFGNATQTGANMANTFTGLGNANAAGALGGANALSGGLQGATNALSLPYLLSAFKNGGQSGTPNAGIYSNNSSFTPPPATS